MHAIQGWVQYIYKYIKKRVSSLTPTGIAKWILVGYAFNMPDTEKKHTNIDLAFLACHIILPPRRWPPLDIPARGKLQPAFRVHW